MVDGKLLPQVCNSGIAQGRESPALSRAAAGLMVACGSIHLSSVLGKDKVPLGGPRTTKDKRIRQGPET